MSLDNKKSRHQKAARVKLQDKGILYSDYLGVYGNVLEGFGEGNVWKTLPEYLAETALEAGFLYEKTNTSLYGNTDVYQIEIGNDHTYSEALAYNLGMSIKSITLYIGEMSAKLIFHGENYGGIVFNMIDGICDFLNVCCLIDSHGWIQEESAIEGMQLLKMYQDQYYRALSKKLKDA